MFFRAALIIFILFSVGYGLVSSAVIYHLRRYTLPGYETPRRAQTLFVFLSVLLWLWGLILLFKIPT